MDINRIHRHLWHIKQVGCLEWIKDFINHIKIDYSAQKPEYDKACTHTNRKQGIFFFQQKTLNGDKNIEIRGDHYNRNIQYCRIESHLIAIMYAATRQPFIQKKTDPKNEMPTDRLKVYVEHVIIDILKWMERR